MKLSFVFVVLVVTASCQCGSPNLINKGAYIEAEPLALDFGPVPVSLSGTLPIKIRNLGQKDLIVEPAEFDSVDYAGPTESVRLTPGENRDIEIAFLPTTEGARNAVLHLVNNSENDHDVAIQLTGIGVPTLSCGNCNMPPPNYCASATTLVTYEKIGTCQNNMCLYQASQLICGGACVSGACSGNDAGAGGGGGGTGGGSGGGGGSDSADAGCIDGRMRSCTPSMCGSGLQTCTANMWGGCEACKSFAVGAICSGGRCCIANGELAISPTPTNNAPYTYCVTDPKEAAGLAPGVTITPTFANPYVTGKTSRCCTKRATVVGSSTDCTYGSWEIRCAP